ncbi:hypothetical protein LBMAG46_04180 [Planctomycetia bacterium]|nr:hypothetical protein LBMAG46_04180 [Planctomycetia bacterium]
MDEVLSESIHLHHQRIDSPRQKQVSGHSRDGNQQSDGGCEQCQCDAVGECFRLAHGSGSGDIVEGVNHADNGSQQSDERAECGHPIQHSQAFLQVTDLAFTTVQHCLFDFDAGTPPFADPMHEDVSDRAVILLADGQCFRAIHATGAEMHEEAFDKCPRDHSTMPQHHQPFNDRPDSDDGSNDEGDGERPSHGFGDPGGIGWNTTGFIRVFCRFDRRWCASHRVCW